MKVDRYPKSFRFEKKTHQTNLQLINDKSKNTYILCSIHTFKNWIHWIPLLVHCEKIGEDLKQKFLPIVLIFLSTKYFMWKKMLQLIVIKLLNFLLTQPKLGIRSRNNCTQIPKYLDLMYRFKVQESRNNIFVSDYLSGRFYLFMNTISGYHYVLLPTHINT